MGLSFYFKFTAPASTRENQLETFLKGVEQAAQRLGFRPTLVINAPFDTRERQEFARRLTTGLHLENPALKNIRLRDHQVWHHDPVNGTCRVIPDAGVVLVITNEHRQETIFGFLKYPRALLDTTGREILRIGVDHWTFEDHAKTPDQRLRSLVKMFAQAGYLESMQDDFAQAQ